VPKIKYYKLQHVIQQKGVARQERREKIIHLAAKSANLLYTIY
jgi:hypothetical protein